MNNEKILGNEIVVVMMKSIQDKLNSKCNLVVKNLDTNITQK